MKAKKNWEAIYRAKLDEAQKYDERAESAKGRMLEYDFGTEERRKWRIEFQQALNDYHSCIREANKAHGILLRQMSARDIASANRLAGR